LTVAAYDGGFGDWIETFDVIFFIDWKCNGSACFQYESVFYCDVTNVCRNVSWINMH